jgi:hypothetical protein
VIQHTRLVAREAEQAQIESALARLRSGQGGLLMLAGEPGIGKSTLALWLAERARQLGCAVHCGYAWEAGGAPPYWPWTQCLRSMLTAQPDPQARKSLDRLLPELAGPVESGDPAGPRLEPELARFRILEAVREMLRVVSRVQPLVLLLEDLHAADRESLNLLQYQSRHVGSMPVLLVGTFRELEAQLSPDTEPLWRSARSAQLLRLSAFGLESIRDYLKQQTGVPVNDELAAQLLTRTEGNPLFVTELLHVLARQPQGAQVVGQIPQTIHQVILQHLAVLPETTRQPLRAAAVMGRAFSATALAALVGGEEEQITAVLELAVQAGLLSSSGPGTFSFNHVFHRDALYQSLAPEQRRELHLKRSLQLQKAIERGQADLWNELGEHLAAAGETHQPAAVQALRQAAQRARQRFAFSEAAALLKRALSLHEAYAVTQATSDPTERAELQLACASALLEAGEVSSGREICRRVFTTAREAGGSGLMGRAALVYGSVFSIAQVDPHLVTMLQQALRLADDSGNCVRARLQARLAAALQPALDPGEPIALAREAIALARSTGDAGCLYTTLSSALSAMVDFAPALERVPLNQEYARLAQQFDDAPAQFRACSFLFFDAIELVEPALLEEAFTVCRQMAARIDLPHFHWRVSSMQGLLAAMRGDLEMARQHWQQATDQAEQASIPTATLALAIQNLSLVSAQTRPGRDELEAAQALLESSSRAAQSVDIFFRPLMALAWLNAGYPSEARAACPAAVVQQLLGMNELSCIQLLGECAVLQQDTELASQVVQKLQGCENLCGHSSLYGMSFHGPMALTLARLNALLGNWDEARSGFAQAEEIAVKLGATRFQLAAQQALATIDGDHAVKQAAAASPLSLPQPSPPRVALHRQSGAWQVRFEHAEALLPHRKGLGILAQLLEQPGREWHVLDLVSSEEGSRLEQSAPGPALDNQARQAYRQRLQQLQEQLEEARELQDEGRVEQLLDEQDALQGELGRAFGLGGRSRPTGSSAERARVNVTRQLRAAIQLIGKEIPAAGRFLQSTVKTGRFCSFEPL